LRDRFIPCGTDTDPGVSSASPGSRTAPILELRGVSKRYGGVAALTAVDFAAHPGTIHAVLGENGAGKSTLIKIASGVTDPSDGEVYVGGRKVDFRNPTEAMAAGVVCVFQELSLIPDMTVADNLSIVDPPRRFGLIDGRAQRRRARELLARVGCEDLHPSELVKNLPLSRRQMVEIAKALGKTPKVLILDEATSALTAEDVQRVYAIIRRLRDEGVAILYVSHRMQEIEDLADVASVFRNGRHIETFQKGDRSVDEIVQMMIGRDVKHPYPEKPAPRPEAPVALAARGLSWGRELRSVSLDVRKGEIVGLGGLDGQGQRELLLALFGVLKNVSGTVEIAGKPVKLTGPRAAMRGDLPLALIPEDRKTEGLMLPMSVEDNMSLAALSRFERGMSIDRDLEAAAIGEMVEGLKVKAGDLRAPVSNLSGGNQQKVVLAKWLMTRPGIVLLNDPTRGIDVGTKQEIYRLLRDLANQGLAVLFYSTDYAELIGCCDRVLVMYGGTVSRELSGDALNETTMIETALNVGGRAA
jgi:ribose transport system ATP-binding protein